MKNPKKSKDHLWSRLYLRFLIVILLLAISLFATVETAKADTILTFQQAFLLDMTLQDDWSVSGSTLGGMAAAPLYSDNTAMSGVAGANGNIGGLADETVYLGLGLSYADVIEHFGGLDLTGFTELSVTAYNDNDDIWSAGVWIKTRLNGVVRGDLTPVNGSTAGPPMSANVSLDLTGLNLSEVEGIGVLIGATLTGGNNPSAGDAYHMSWSPVPEPATMLMFGTGLIGIAGLGRKKVFKRK